MSLVPCKQQSVGLRRLGTRLKASWLFKLIACILMTTGFFAGYFACLYYPVFAVTEMPVTAIDRLIGFWPNGLIVYMTLWVYVPLGLWLSEDRQELVTCTAALCGLGVVGLAVYFFWPTAVPRPDIDLVEYPGFAPLIAIDEPRNVFPCLHAAFAVFAAACIGRLLRHMGDRGALRVLNWCWCLGILYSTVATKQHLALDLFAGTALGAAWAGLYMRVISRRDIADGRAFSAGSFPPLPTPPVGGTCSSTP